MKRSEEIAEISAILSDVGVWTPSVFDLAAACIFALALRALALCCPGTRLRTPVPRPGKSTYWPTAHRSRRTVSTLCATSGPTTITTPSRTRECSRASACGSPARKSTLGVTSAVAFVLSNQQNIVSMHCRDPMCVVSGCALPCTHCARRKLRAGMRTRPPSWSFATPRRGVMNCCARRSSRPTP